MARGDRLWLFKQLLLWLLWQFLGLHGCGLLSVVLLFALAWHATGLWHGMQWHLLSVVMLSLVLQCKQGNVCACPDLGDGRCMPGKVSEEYRKDIFNNHSVQSEGTALVACRLPQKYHY
jgi:hypothetical protein